MPVLPELSDDLITRLRAAFREADYTADGVVDALGPVAHAALGRGEPEVAKRESEDSGDLGALVRLFLLGDTEPDRSVRSALAGVDLDEAVRAGVLTPTATGSGPGLTCGPTATTRAPGG